MNSNVLLALLSQSCTTTARLDGTHGLVPLQLTSLEVSETMALTSRRGGDGAGDYVDQTSLTASVYSGNPGLHNGHAHLHDDSLDSRQPRSTLHSAASAALSVCQSIHWLFLTSSSLWQTCC